MVNVFLNDNFIFTANSLRSIKDNICQPGYCSKRIPFDEFFEIDTCSVEPGEPVPTLKPVVTPEPVTQSEPVASDKPVTTQTVEITMPTTTSKIQTTTVRNTTVATVTANTVPVVTVEPTSEVITE